MKTSLTALSLALTIATGFAAPAMAQEEPFSIRFAYKAEELKTDASRHALLLRLENEVERQCVTSPGAAGKHNARPCVARTMSNAVSRIGSKELAAAFEATNAG